MWSGDDVMNHFYGWEQPEGLAPEQAQRLRGGCNLRSLFREARRVGGPAYAAWAERKRRMASEQNQAHGNDELSNTLTLSEGEIDERLEQVAMVGFYMRGLLQVANAAMRSQSPLRRWARGEGSR